MKESLSIIFLLILSAFFSASETAFFSISKFQIKKNEKKKKYKLVFLLLEKPQILLILILLCNTLVNILASSIVALFAIKLANKFSTENLDLYLILVEIVIFTPILIIFGEIVPKIFAYLHSMKFAKFSAYFLLILKYIFYPIIYLLDLIGNLIINSSKENNNNITAKDIKNIIYNQNEKNLFDEQEKRIIHNVFNFSNIRASEIKKTRLEIVAAEKNIPKNKLIKLFKRSGYSRIPIYEENIDNICGFIYAKDFILKNFTNINEILRKPIIIPENKKLYELLNIYKAEKIHIAIVVDEYGGTSGLITLEDVLEVLVGEINDEYDKIKNEKNFYNNGKELLLNGNTGLYIVKQYLDNEEIFEEDKYDNLAEFLIDKFNKVPAKGEKYIYKEKIEFSIEKADEQKIILVKLKKLT